MVNLDLSAAPPVNGSRPYIHADEQFGIWVAKSTLPPGMNAYYPLECTITYTLGGWVPALAEVRPVLTSTDGLYFVFPVVMPDNAPDSFSIDSLVLLKLRPYNTALGVNLTDPDLGLDATVSQNLALIPHPAVILSITPNPVLQTSVSNGFAVNGERFWPNTGAPASIKLKKVGTTEYTQGEIATSNRTSTKFYCYFPPLIPASYEIIYENASGIVTAPINLDVQSIPAGGTTSYKPVITGQDPIDPMQKSMVVLYGLNFLGQPSPTGTYGTTELINVGTGAVIDISSRSTSALSFNVPLGMTDGTLLKVKTTSAYGGIVMESDPYALSMDTIGPSISTVISDTFYKDTSTNIAVTITGQRFSVVPGGKVSITGFGDIATTSWTNEEIKLLINPAAILQVNENLTEFEFQVTRFDSMVSNLLALNIIERGIPNIDSITPQTTSIGKIIEIRGLRFGTVGGSIMWGDTLFSYGSVAIEVFPSWTDDYIAMKIPAGLTTANLKIIRLGDDAESNSVAVNIVPESSITPPAISSIAPSSGAVETSVVITGINFGAYNSVTHMVTIGANIAAIDPTKWTDTSITLAIPKECYGGINWVQVKTNLGASNPVEFVVTGKAEPDTPPVKPGETTPAALPTIDASIPAYTAEGGTRISISGRYFADQTAESKIVFRSNTGQTVNFTPLTWTDNNIEINLHKPIGHSDNGDFIVYNAGGASNALRFTVVPESPVITSITPNPVVAGTTVIIDGAKFGTGLDTVSCFVRFGATQADVLPRTSIQSWTDTRIQFIVPDSYDYSREQIQVVADGLLSEWHAFYVEFDPSVLVDPSTISLGRIQNLHGQLVSRANRSRPPITGIPPGSPIVYNLNADKLDGMHYEDITEYVNQKAARVPGIIENLKSVNNVFPDVNNNIKLCGAENVVVSSYPETNEIVISVVLNKDELEDGQLPEETVVDYIKRVTGKNGIVATTENRVVYVAANFGTAYDQIARGNHTHNTIPATYA